MSKFKYAKFKMRRKVKVWWHLGEEKLRDIGGRMKRGKKRSESAAGLYAGV